jgi:asparagine synthase (glutamine-hydrolysing)
MCGLVGIVGGNPTGAEVDGMLSRIRHRGPDGEGVFLAAGVALGHVRLSIVDPTQAGAQPMFSPDGRYCLLYNGELYNHRDFRNKLQSIGVCFRGHSDTETLLWLLIHHGESILPVLNGIFAFAFYDTLTGVLLLARDHMGVKPLYYATGKDGRLLFGSEIKALFAPGDVEPRVNADDIVELFMFHFIAGERTAFANVTELAPGHSLRYCGGRTTVSEYWNVATAARNGAQTDCDPFLLHNLVRTAVERQLMSDVPVGIMSSGGLDSGIVTAFAGGSTGGMSGFCFRDPSLGYDEFEQARNLSLPFGVTVEDVRVREADIPDLLAKLTWHYDEPLPRPHHLAAYAVAQRAQSAGLKVLISGEGGDELFGGYVRYRDFSGPTNRTPGLDPLVFGHNGVAIPRIGRFCSRNGFLNGYRFRCAAETSGLDPINRQLVVDQKTFLQHFLQRSDRMGMAAGVEIRVPLLDIPLVEYTNRLPGSAKVDAGNLKLCLKAAARGTLPSDAIDRPKQAFEMPMAPLLNRGPVADCLDDLLLSAPRCGDLFDADAIVQLVADLRGGHEELWKVVWLVLSTEVWMRTFNVSV